MKLNALICPSDVLVGVKTEMGSPDPSRCVKVIITFVRDRALSDSCPITQRQGQTVDDFRSLLSAALVLLQIMR